MRTLESNFSHLGEVYADQIRGASSCRFTAAVNGILGLSGTGFGGNLQNRSALFPVTRRHQGWFGVTPGVLDHRFWTD